MKKLFFKLFVVSVTLIGLVGCTPAVDIDTTLVDTIIIFNNAGLIVAYGLLVVGLFKKKFDILLSGVILLIALYMAYYFLGLMYPAAGFGLGFPG